MAIVTGWNGEVISDETMPDSVNCGLVQMLLLALLNDPLVIGHGGMLQKILHRTNVFNGFHNHTRQAQENCEVNVYVNLQLVRFTHERGKEYLLGASYANYDMVFLHQAGRSGYLGRMVVDMVLLKTQEFGDTAQSAQSFVGRYGYRWHFCYCRRDPNDPDIYRRCLQMN